MEKALQRLHRQLLADANHGNAKSAPLEKVLRIIENSFCYGK